MVIFIIIIICVLIFVYWQAYEGSYYVEQGINKVKGYRYNYFNIYTFSIIRNLDDKGNDPNGINLFNYYGKNGYDLRGFNKYGYDKYGYHITRIRY